MIRLIGANKILAAFLMLFLALLLGSCHPLKPFSNIQSDDAARLIKSSQNSADFVILDVRTPEEFAGGYINGAVNLDFKSPDFAARLDKLDKSKTYLVYCRTGGRSAKAMSMMKEKSFERVYNLSGGITDWTSRQQPLSGKTE